MSFDRKHYFTRISEIAAFWIDNARKIGMQPEHYLLFRLTEEVGELMRSYRPDRTDNKSEEIGDVMNVFMIYLHVSGLNIDSAFKFGLNKIIKKDLESRGVDLELKSSSQGLSPSKPIGK